MQLFQSMEGYIFSFGFNMQARKPDPHYIGWCDPTTRSWEPDVTNQAGWIDAPFFVDPFDIEQPKGGLIIARQPSHVIVLMYIGPPLVWSYTQYLYAQAIKEGIISEAKVA